MNVGAGVGVAVSTSVDVGAGVAVGVLVGVDVAVAVDVYIGVGVAIEVAVGVEVDVDVGSSVMVAAMSCPAATCRVGISSCGASIIIRVTPAPIFQAKFAILNCLALASKGLSILEC